MNIWWPEKSKFHENLRAMTLYFKLQITEWASVWTFVWLKMRMKLVKNVPISLIKSIKHENYTIEAESIEMIKPSEKQKHFGLTWIIVCFFKPLLVPNIFEHLVHSYCRSFVWMFMCVRSDVSVRNALPQISHILFLSPCQNERKWFL